MNVVWLIGNIAKEADAAVTSTGKSVANFRLATNEGWGEKKVTDYHNIVAWDKLAEEAHRHGKVGARVMVQGRIRTRNYESKKHEGEKVYITEVVAESLKFLTDDEDLSGISFGG